MASTRLSAAKIAALDPYKFMAVIGTRVIVPYLGYIVAAGTEPAMTGAAAASARADVVGAHR